MTQFMEGSGVLILWLGFLLLMIIGITAVFLWGVRSRQFSDQDRARYLPLKIGHADNYPDSSDAEARSIRDDA